MTFTFKNRIVVGLKSLLSIAKTLILNLKSCLCVKKIFELLLLLSVFNILMAQIYINIKNIFFNNNYNHSCCSSSDIRKYRPLTSNSSCSACNSSSSSSNYSKSSGSSSSSSSSSSTYIDKKYVKNILRKYKITV